LSSAGWTFPQARSSERAARRQERPLFFSHDGPRTNRRMIRDVGLRIVSARVAMTDEDGDPVPFLWVVAEKPGLSE
jgi:hypothetical protein